MAAQKGPARRTATAKKNAAKKAAAKAPHAKTTATAAAKPSRSAAAAPKTEPQARPVPFANTEVCPRCGTVSFRPEERTRVDGRRTVRYTVLVCERGHTFARPVTRQA